MRLEVIVNDITMTYDLNELGVKYSGVVNIVQKCKQVWNTIAIESESVDPFQCHLIGSAESWRMNEGQNRTERNAPKDCSAVSLFLVTVVSEDALTFMLVVLNTISVIQKLRH